MASDVRAEESIRQHKPMDPTDIESLLSEVRSNIITAGTHGFVAFHVELKSRYGSCDSIEYYPVADDRQHRN